MMIPEAVTGMVRLLSSPAFLTAQGGRVFFANQSARESFGLASETPNLSLMELISDSAEAMADYLRMCARSPSPIPGAFRFKRPGAEPAAYLSKGALLSTADGARLLLLRLERKDAGNPFILLSQTIEELRNEVNRRRDAEAALRASEDALRLRAQQLEDANQLKDEFLAALSHELRTPLNSILGWATILREHPPTPERLARGLDVIQRNGRLQLQLIEELLDISRIVSGKLRLNVQQLDPIGFVEAAIEAVRPAMDAKNIRLQAVLDPDAGMISGDPDRLQQVLWNLLINATKFSNKGGRIQVVLERVDSNVQISVADMGLGIAREFLPHVFEKFRQQDGATTRVHGGLGLGLAIAKNLVELHGGSISAASDGIGQGATFVIVLPRTLVKPSASARPFQSAADPVTGEIRCPPQLQGVRVLAVDDEQDALDFMTDLLERCGMIVVSATSTEQALAMVRADQPDIIISDIGMPGGDGYQLIQSVRAMPANDGGSIPAVALTAFARTEDRTRALRSGFQAHVPKPVDFRELLAVLVSVVRRP